MIIFAARASAFVLGAKQARRDGYLQSYLVSGGISLGLVALGIGAIVFGVNGDAPGLSRSRN